MVSALAPFPPPVVFHKPVSSTYHVWRVFNPAAESATNSAARLASGGVGCAQPAQGRRRSPNRSTLGIRRFIDGTLNSHNPLTNKTVGEAPLANNPPGRRPTNPVNPKPGFSDKRRVPRAG